MPTGKVLSNEFGDELNKHKFPLDAFLGALDHI